MNLEISNPEIYTYSLSPPFSKIVLPSKSELSSAPENFVVSQIFDLPKKTFLPENRGMVGQIFFHVYKQNY